MINVSFDFDDTLDKLSVQQYAKDLVNRGDINLWVITTRYDDENLFKYGFEATNKDLWDVVKLLNIKREQVVFTSMVFKYNFLKDMDILWHLDNDYDEIKKINKFTNTTGISVFGNYVNKCNKMLWKTIQK